MCWRIFTRQVEQRFILQILSAQQKKSVKNGKMPIRQNFPRFWVLFGSFLIFLWRIFKDIFLFQVEFVSLEVFDNYLNWFPANSDVTITNKPVVG